MPRFAALIVLLALAAPLARADGPPPLVDPLDALRAQADAVGQRVLDAFPRYDAAAIALALETIEGRIAAAPATAIDRHLAAQACLELAVIHRHYDRNDFDHMPAALSATDAAEWAERGLAHARALETLAPAHADARRLEGELLSFQIRGMVSGMTKGPEAKKAIEKALELDPTNLHATVALGRMYYHNPAIAGGDKERALAVFRDAFERRAHFRASTYIGLCYEVKQMYPQARYWAAKTLELAPGNPEAEKLLARIERAEAGR